MDTPYIEELKVEEKRPRMGRPPLTIEQKAANREGNVAAKREYSKKWRESNKEKQQANNKRSVARIVSEKRYWCPTCNKAFPSSGNLKYHLQIARVHAPP